MSILFRFANNVLSVGLSECEVSLLPLSQRRWCLKIWGGSCRSWSMEGKRRREILLPVKGQLQLVLERLKFRVNGSDTQGRLLIS